MDAAIDADTPLTETRLCLEALGRTLATARLLVQEGRPIDLTGLDADMGTACARTLDLPPEDGRALRPMLIGLGLKLEALSVAFASRAPPPLSG